MQLVQAIEHTEFLENIFHVGALEVTGCGSLLEQCIGDVPDVVLRYFDDVEGVEGVDKIFFGSLGLPHFLKDGGQLHGDIYLQGLVDLRKIHEIFG